MANNLHTPLYLAHRPRTLAQLVGQSTVVTTLGNAIAQNRLSHAYLFTGPRGTGKTSTARILAKSLNCQSGPTTEPCLECTSCQEITKGVSPAVFEIDAASNNSVDDARVLIERAPLVAVGGRFKLYIIDECHMLSKDAFNALLKTIEEPPPNVIFILATTEEHKVLPTIVSRCQRLMFRLVNQEDLKPHLSKVAGLAEIEIEDSALDLIARRSGGGLRDALSLLDQASLLAQKGQAVSVDNLLSLFGAIGEDTLCLMSQYIKQRDGQALLVIVNQLLQQGREPALIAQELARHFLNLAKAFYLPAESANSTEAQALILGSPAYLTSLSQQAREFERPEIAQIVESLDKLESTIRRSSQPSMHLEMELLGLCHRQELLLVKELLSRVETLESKLEQNNYLPTVRPTPKTTNTPTTSSPVTNPPLRPATNQTPPAIAPDTPTESAVTTVAPVTPVTSATPVTTATPVTAETQVSAETLAPVAETAEDSGKNEDLEEFWSSLIDTLADHHRPTWSLVSMHAFAVSLTQKELTVGVLKANFQKMIEGKSEHLKKACELLLGHSVIIKVKVLSQAPIKTGSNTVSQSAALPSPASPESISPSPEPISRPNPAPAATVPAKPSPASDDDDSYLAKEAYQLFDGPGSRQIG